MTVISKGFAAAVSISSKNTKLYFAVGLNAIVGCVRAAGIMKKENK